MNNIKASNHKQIVLANQKICMEEKNLFHRWYQWLKRNLNPLKMFELKKIFSGLLISVAYLGSLGLILSHDLNAQVLPNQFPNRTNAFEKLGTLNSPLIPESSGIALAETQENAFWTINDSGHTNDLFCVSFSGRVLAKVTLQNAKNVDWESMAWFVKDGVRYLVVADVGDNNARRQQLQIYFLPEPEFQLQEEMVKLKRDCFSFRFVYPDGARDCEAVAIDPETLDIWLAEKIMRPRGDRKPPGLYRISADKDWFRRAIEAAELKPQQSVVSPIETEVISATREGDLSHLFITGMDFSRDGRFLIMRNYLQALLFEKKNDQTWAEALTSTKPSNVRLPLQRQGETITFTSDSRSVIITSEFVGQPIWKIGLDSVMGHARSEP